MRVGTEAVRAAKHDTTARSATPQKNSDNRLRVAKKFTLFDTPSTPPRPLHSFQHFASICYGDLRDVLCDIGARAQATCSAEATGSGVPSGIPRLGVGSSRQRRRERQSAAIDTVSNNVTLLGLALEFMHQTASEMSVPGSEVCWLMDTGLPISPRLSLAFSSSLSSKECFASAALHYAAVAFEASLQLELGAFLHLYLKDPAQHCIAPRHVRSVTTVAQIIFSCLRLCRDAVPSSQLSLVTGMNRASCAFPSRSLLSTTLP